MSFESLVVAYSLLLAILLDVLFGEPKRWHPLVGFGYLASLFERGANPVARGNISTDNPHFFIKLISFLTGIVGWLLLVIVPMIVMVIGITLIERMIAASWWIDAIILYLAIGHTSLRQHALAIVLPLQNGDIEQARKKLSMIVSRDTEHLDENGICQSTVESVLENGSDAIFAPIFWFLVGGIPAVIVYRLTNTLDAMWGYKTERFIFFGRFSARMDDILNWVPSRLVGISYALLGKTKDAFRCWYQQAYSLESPSGGVVMTAGAGALNVLLGGDTQYHGKMKSKPVFGCGHTPLVSDVHASLRLVNRTLLLWCVCIVVGLVVFKVSVF